jgi:predicted metal-dependent hydrolase
VGDHELLHGITLFNTGKFFDAHEVLEDVWRAAPPDNKKFCQGLVQVAVAFHHYSTGNRVGMRSVLERAIRNLAEPAGAFQKFDLAPLLQSLDHWRKAIDDDSTVPALPHIQEVSADNR